MKVIGVDVYGYELRYAHGSYVMSDGREITTLPSTVVRVRTDEGVAGFGEACPLGNTYLPSFAAGVRAALPLLAEAVLGCDPREVAVVKRRMDGALRGQPAAKSAIDVACWDILGQATGVPIATLLGGSQSEDFPLYVAVPLGTPQAMIEHVRVHLEAGIRRFQLKVGSAPREDARRAEAVLEAVDDDTLVIADANGGWSRQDAVIAAGAMAGLDGLLLEEPCATLEECLLIRRITALPMVLDEVIVDCATLARAAGAGGMEAVNLKIGRLGGLTAARRARDLAEQLGLRVVVEDTWGGDIVTAAVSHVAASTPPGTLMHASFMNDWTLDHVAGHQPRAVAGRGSAPRSPGLGLEVDVTAFGRPLAVVSAPRG